MLQTMLLPAPLGGGGGGFVVVGGLFGPFVVDGGDGVVGEVAGGLPLGEVVVAATTVICSFIPLEQ